MPPVAGAIVPSSPAASRRARRLCGDRPRRASWQTDDGSSRRKRTYIGFRNGQWKGDNQTAIHRLSLTTPPMVNTQHQHRRGARFDPGNPLATLTIDPRRLSVSEPASGGYGFSRQRRRRRAFETRPDPDQRACTPSLRPPFRLAKRNDGGQIFQYGRDDPAYRFIYLQRLANPLLPYKPLNADGTAAGTTPIARSTRWPLT